MNFDLRFPLGLMFSLFGVLLLGFGAMSDAAIYRKSLGLNINLIWGAVLLTFGVAMLLLARKKAGK